MNLIRINADDSQWDEVVRSLKGCNNYHSAAYYRLAAEMDGGHARLLLFESDDFRAAIPLIVRKIDSRLAPGAEDLFDATSVYGYPGVLSNS